MVNRYQRVVNLCTISVC